MSDISVSSHPPYLTSICYASSKKHPLDSRIDLLTLYSLLSVAGSTFLIRKKVQALQSRN
ncbi:hypothetical protein SLEP1_g55803 [Rubroshorea leprosula]|uniref:Uncharacterized protein n=1 Tax=Rubroshorea leprosula TaxID=152421 RepID=A0AAV5MGM7_9ROSI|nr:hypothetical protein SLEP1_g55803 [Rubroshorea leprosula]